MRLIVSTLFGLVLLAGGCGARIEALPPGLPPECRVYTPVELDALQSMVRVDRDLGFTFGEEIEVGRRTCHTVPTVEAECWICVLAVIEQVYP